MTDKGNRWHQVKQTLRRHVTDEVLLRVSADAIMLSFSLAVAYVIRYVVATSTPVLDVPSARRLLGAYSTAYGNNVGLLVLTGMIVFYLSGFYTHGRAYQSRFKAMVIIQAVTVSYLIFAAANYVAPSLFAAPRSVLFGSYLISVALLLGTRVWSAAWKRLAAWQLRQIPRGVNMPPRLVLLIGGAGYIGSTLLPKLLAKGYRVRLLDLFVYGKKGTADLLDHPHLDIVEGDFRHVDVVVNAMQGVDTVIHLGAIVGDPACALNEQVTREVNLVATRMIAEAAKGSGVGRFIFASTCSVYGASNEILDEHSALSPISVYAASKVACEKILGQMASTTFAPVILRFGTIYGVSKRMRFDLVVNLLTAKAVYEQKITLYGGDQWRPFVHVGDVARAILLALEAARLQVHNQVFNIGGDDENCTLREVGEAIQRVVPDAEILELGSDEDCRNYRVGFAKARNRLNFTPQWTLEDGVRQVAEALGGGLAKDYQALEYSNVQFLSKSGKDILVPEDGWAEMLIASEGSFAGPHVGSD